MGADDLERRVEETLKTLPESERAEAAKSTQAETDPIKDITAPLDGLPDDASPVRVEEALRSLAFSLKGFDALRCATVREAVVKKLERFGISSPARMVDAAFQDGQSGTSGQQQGQPVLCEDPQPWPEAVDGATLLNEIVTILKRFIILPPHAAEAAALWVFHSHSLDAFSISPLFTITSPVKRSGKTLFLEFLSLLVPRNLLASSISPAAFFRVIEKFAPSLLIDEGDALFKGKDDSNEELRGIIDAGHRKSSAFVVRCIGDKHEPTRFATWCPKAIALIGKLPGTLEDRSIVIPMKRKGIGESIEKFKNNKVEPPLEILKRKAIRWANDNINKLRKIEPEDQEGLNDRATNNWEPLLAVADCVGGGWPKVARAAAKGLSSSVDEADSSVSIQLLVDLRGLFAERGADKLPSEDICKALGEMEERPWPEWGRQKKPITPPPTGKTA